MMMLKFTNYSHGPLGGGVRREWHGLLPREYDDDASALPGTLQLFLEEIDGISALLLV